MMKDTRNRIVTTVKDNMCLTGLLIDQELRELYMDPQDDPDIVGAIRLGTILKRVPGLEGSFVRIGEGKVAYLKYRGMIESVRETYASMGIHFENNTLPVQICADAVGDKPIEVTPALSLAGRYCVVSLPNQNMLSLAFSKKIGAAQREILSDALEGELDEDLALLLRTSCRELLSGETISEILGTGPSEILGTGPISEGTGPSEVLGTGPSKTVSNETISEVLGTGPSETVSDGTTSDKTNEKTSRAIEVIREEYRDLCAKMHGILERAQHAASHALLYPGETKAEWIKKRFVEEVEEICEETSPAILDGLRHIDEKVVKFKSGANIAIEQTRAMTVIDVDTGEDLRRGGSFQDLAFAVNLDLAPLIAKEIRLRNISGIIVIDFLKMRKEDEGRLIEAMRRETGDDPIRTKVHGITDLGLMEITREKKYRRASNVPCFL